MSGVLDHQKLSSPLPPSALGPLGATVGPNSSIRKLYVYWGQNCAHGPNPAPGGFCPLWDTFSLFLNLSELVPNFGRGRPFCTVLLPCPLDVQRALCTMKVVVINVQGSLCTSASGKGVRPHIHIGPCASLGASTRLAQIQQRWYRGVSTRWQFVTPHHHAYNPPTLGSGVLDLPKLSSPLPPSALGPSPPDVGPNSSIFTLYVYWGQNLVDVDQILRRGGYRPTFASI